MMNRQPVNKKQRARKVPFRSRGMTKERAMAAARRILLEEGYARLTMERVAQESRIAKTTIYRRWPTKAALCMDLYLGAALKLHDPEAGDVASDLKSFAEDVVRLQTRTVAGPALVGLIAEAQINPDTNGPFLAEFAVQRRSVTRLILRRAIERGELQSDTDIDLVIDALGGAITFRLLQGHAPINKKFTDELIDLVLCGCKEQKPVQNQDELESR